MASPRAGVSSKSSAEEGFAFKLTHMAVGWTEFQLSSLPRGPLHRAGGLNTAGSLKPAHKNPWKVEQDRSQGVFVT